ncbi:asparaginase [Aquibacillus kalidii]|uniref:asparaginase n=1 Tax=Aquibacillus kalidii TaxID=2762597 RepID=UPI0016470311|nr:asparaginase [Aquibacillus kalidii]
MTAIQVYRGNYLESSHQIHVAVVNAKGELHAYYGDPLRLTFARSSMKPFQAVPIVESGSMEAYDLTDRELSLFCASHNGEPIHREAVKEVLNKLHLQEDHLQCGTHIPRDTESYQELLKSGGELTQFFSNCSGKHSGMLAACSKQGFDLQTYRDVTHPYQQQIIEVIEDVSDYPQEKIKTSVDGCGVPVHRLPLFNLAKAFARLGSKRKWSKGTPERVDALNRIRKAMITYPEMVAGTKRFDTDLMKAYRDRIVAKVGAEGVHCFADHKTGIGVAIKVEDGNERATNVASMEVLKQLNIGDESVISMLSDYHYAPVLNARKEQIGEIRPNFTLNYL